MRALRQGEQDLSASDTYPGGSAGDQGGGDHLSVTPKSTPSFTVTLRDYVDVVELRMRATMLATACGLGRRQQGLVAVAVTEAGVFALQHVGRSAAELRVENDDASSRLMVVVRGAGSVVGLAESRLPALGEDGGLVLAERAAERFSVSTEPRCGTKVTMGWALPPAGRTVGKDEPLASGDQVYAASSLLDVLHGENREVAVVLEALGDPEAAIEANSELIGRLTGDLERANRELIALHWELDLAREAEACLAAAVHLSDDARFSMTPELVVTSWNPGAERLLGYTAEEMIGLPAQILIAEGALGEFGSALERLREARVASYETFRRRKDGSLVEAALTVSAMRDGGGRLIGYSAVLRDLADRARAEEQATPSLADKEDTSVQDRLSHDLQDVVMDRLFACGMSLRNTLMLDRRSEVVTRVERVIDELGAGVADLLQEQRSAGGPGSVR